MQTGLVRWDQRKGASGQNEGGKWTKQREDWTKRREEVDQTEGGEGGCAQGSAVNQIAVAESQVFVATASNDETVKVWDVRRFERDVSFRSRLTYTGQVLPFPYNPKPQMSWKIFSVSRLTNTSQVLPFPHNHKPQMSWKMFSVSRLTNTGQVLPFPHNPKP